MDNIYLYIITVFFGFLAMMNPIGSTPIFIGLTKGMSNSDKRSIAFKSLVIAFIIVVIFIVMGKFIFQLFGITLPAFRITGGILLFITGMRMLLSDNPGVDTKSMEEMDIKTKTRIAVSPLGIPILAGPGTIAAAMNFVADGSVLSILITSGIFLILCILSFLLFISGQKLVNFLGENVIQVVSRLMGLILSVIGTEMIISGIRGAIEVH
ncbi:MAG TPA: MarC family protein [Ignavibacteria bacterium]|nr:MarC family protein [Ignavibacteria bacterium]